jgi:hypothetical protein
VWCCVLLDCACEGTATALANTSAAADSSLTAQQAQRQCAALTAFPLQQRQ